MVNRKLIFLSRDYKDDDNDDDYHDNTRISTRVNNTAVYGYKDTPFFLVMLKFSMIIVYTKHQPSNDGENMLTYFPLTNRGVR